MRFDLRPERALRPITLAVLLCVLSAFLFSAYPVDAQEKTLHPRHSKAPRPAGTA